MRAATAELDCITSLSQAAVLMDPLRIRILRSAREPASATEIAGRLRLPRQRVNYHVRELARVRLLRRAGDRKRGNLIERRFVATARAYVLAPQVLGELRADPSAVADVLSAEHLAALASQAQADLAAVLEQAAAQCKRVATLSLASAFRFETPDQRRGFTEALQSAILGVIARHTSPETRADGSPASGRPYRLILGCYPVPREPRAAEIQQETP